MRKPYHIVDSAANGANGLPIVTTTIAVEGHGYEIRRDPAGPKFRIFSVVGGGFWGEGDLTLNDITTRGGENASDPCMPVTELVCNRGGVLNYFGSVALHEAAVVDNKALQGGRRLEPGWRPDGRGLRVRFQ